mgnify:CR=1 FL=1
MSCHLEAAAAAAAVAAVDGSPDCCDCSRIPEHCNSGDYTAAAALVAYR